MDYENFCSEILKNDPKIRFASVFDEWAKPVGADPRGDQSARECLGHRAAPDESDASIGQRHDSLRGPNTAVPTRTSVAPS